MKRVGLLLLIGLSACIDYEGTLCDEAFTCSVEGYVCDRTAADSAGRGRCVRAETFDAGPGCVNGTVEECGPTVPEAGVCRRGTRTCVAGAWSVCEGTVAPGTELCNGFDDDCDGETDEDLETLPACALTQGVCATARMRCVAGALVHCEEADYGPDYEAEETRCDGLDNDCDGLTDEDVTGAALRGEALCEHQQGLCEGVRRACVNGAFETPCTALSYGPDYERMERSCGDGLDNDCSGSQDLSFAVTVAPTQDLFDWVRTDGGVAVVYRANSTDTPGRSAYLRAFDLEFRPLGAAKELIATSGDVQEITLAHTPAGPVVAWLEQNSVLAAVVEFPNGARTSFDVPATSRHLRVAPSQDGLFVMVAWVENSEVWSAVFGLNGDVVEPAARLRAQANPSGVPAQVRGLGLLQGNDDLGAFALALIESNNDVGMGWLYSVTQEQTLNDGGFLGHSVTLQHPHQLRLRPAAADHRPLAAWTASGTPDAGTVMTLQMSGGLNSLMSSPYFVPHDVVWSPLGPVVVANNNTGGISMRRAGGITSIPLLGAAGAPTVVHVEDRTIGVAFQDSSGTTQAVLACTPQ